MYDFPQYQEPYDFSQYGDAAGEQVGCGCGSERVGARPSGGGFDWGGVIAVAAAVGVLVVGYGVYKNVTTIGPAALRGAKRAMEEG
jgi:hypothetical protein